MPEVLAAGVVQPVGAEAKATRGQWRAPQPLLLGASDPAGDPPVYVLLLLGFGFAVTSWVGCYCTSSLTLVSYGWAPSRPWPGFQEKGKAWLSCASGTAILLLLIK